MAKRGISERIFYAHNPLPAVTEAELLAKAGLDQIAPSDVWPFEMRWQYGGSADSEYMTLAPGEFHPLRESEARDFANDLREEGLVLVENPNDAAEVRKKALEGLRTAVQFWRQRGTPKLAQYRKTHGLSENELEEQKYEVWAYYLARAKADAIEAHMNKPAPAPTKATAQASAAA